MEYNFLIKRLKEQSKYISDLDERGLSDERRNLLKSSALEIKENLQKVYKELYCLNLKRGEEKEIEYEGFKYTVKKQPAKHKKDICFPDYYMNGFYVYSDKDPGSSLVNVVIATDNEKLIEDYKLENLKIENGNKLIASYMGYIYHTFADIDNSDCGGIYDRTLIWSKVPVERDEFIEEDQYYLKDDWIQNNYNNIICGPLDYHENYSSLIPVLKKINKEHSFPHYQVKIDMSVGYCAIIIRDARTEIFATYNTNDSWKTAIWQSIVNYLRWKNENHKS